MISGTAIMENRPRTFLAGSCWPSNSGNNMRWDFDLPTPKLHAIDNTEKEAH